MDELRLEVQGEPVPQGRPKFNRRTGGVYYPPTSVAYRKLLVSSFEAQKGGWVAPRGKVGINLYATGMRKKSDADNLLKQIMDALVDAGCIKGDDWEAVPFQLVSVRPLARDEEPHVVVYVTKLSR